MISPTSGTTIPILPLPLDSTPAKSSLKNLNVRPPAKSIPKSVLGELDLVYQLMYLITLELHNIFLQLLLHRY